VSSEEENELLTARLVILVDRIDTIMVRGTTIDMAVFILPEQTIVLQNVRDMTHHLARYLDVLVGCVLGRSNEVARVQLPSI